MVGKPCPGCPGNAQPSLGETIPHHQRCAHPLREPVHQDAEDLLGDAEGWGVEHGVAFEVDDHGVLLDALRALHGGHRAL